MDGRRDDDIYWLHQAGGWVSPVQVLARRWLRSATAASSWWSINVMHPLDIQPWGVRAKINVWIRDPQGVLDWLLMIWSHREARHFPARAKLSETRLTPGANQCFVGVFTHRQSWLIWHVFHCWDKALDDSFKVSVLLNLLLRLTQLPRSSILANQLLPEVDIFFHSTSVRSRYSRQLCWY